MENKKMTLQLIGNMFTVKTDLRDSAGIYEVVDENGILADLQGAEDYEFFKGKRLKCNVISTEGARPLVVLAEKPIKTGGAFSISFSYLQGLIPDRYWRNSVVELLLYNGMEESFETRAYTWLIAQTEGLEGEKLNEFLCDVRGCLMNVMEKSDLLTHVLPDEVDILRDRLSLVIEHTGYVRTALKAVVEGREDEYVSDVIYKLCESGHLYHPKKQLSVMTYIFKMRMEVMESRMEDLLRAIRSKSIAHWKHQEPFRAEIIKQLEEYVRVAERKALYDDRLTWARIFEALAIQLLMADDNEELIDVNLNIAKMSRAGSFFKYASQTRMADMALDAVQGLLKNKFIYSLDDTRNPEILYHKMEDWYRNQDINREQVALYNAKGLSLEISNNIITLRPEYEIVYQKAIFSSKENVPKLWKGLDVMLEKGLASRIPSIKKGADRMSCLKKIWQAVEDGLFDTDRTSTDKLTKTKSCPKIGDKVLTYIYRQENDNTYRCVVSDEDYFGQGIISVKSDEKFPGFVSYSPDSEIEDFRSDDGNPLLIRMKVVGIEQDGSLIFDAKSLIHDYIKEDKPHFIQKCIVVKVEDKLYAVTEGGLFTSVTVTSEDKENITVGDHIEVTIDGARWFVNGIVQGRFLRTIEDDFTVEDAFHNLISDYAEDELKESLENEVKEVNLDKSHIIEILNTLDRLSTTVQDSDAAYCYAGFAGILSRMIGDETRAAGYGRQMEMAFLLHKFAVTDSVDVEELAQLQGECLSDECPDNLRRLFYHLLIVSYMGKDNSALYDRLSGVRLDEMQETLKGYVYSYNVLLDAGLPVDGLRAKIKQTLNLTGREGYVKTYDKSESQTVEFKTSILYPAGSKRPNLRHQTDQILKEVCAFLNRDGGTLYLGVNDLGVGVGLEEDMKFGLFSDSRDKYDRYVRDQIAIHLGQGANHCVSSYFDEACGRDVYVLDIQPCETAVSLYGEYYERQGSSSRKVGPEYLETFLKSKALKDQSERKEMAPAQDAAKCKNDGSGPQEPKKVDTGSFRNNVLHSYEQNYEYSQMYLHFLPDSKWKLCKDDTYEEDITLLTLNLHAADVKDGYVVTVYDNGQVAKVPMAFYLEKAERKLHRSYNGATPVFICPAQKNDVLYMVFEQKGMVFHRLENVSDLREGSIGEAGDMLFDVSFDKILKVEILPDAFREHLPEVITGRKRLGNFWKAAETANMVRFLEEVTPAV